MEKTSHLNCQGWKLKLFTLGFCLGCAISIKFVGAFIVLYVGILTIFDLWILIGDLKTDFLLFSRHFLYRALFLILLPVGIYIGRIGFEINFLEIKLGLGYHAFPRNSPRRQFFTKVAMLSISTSCTNLVLEMHITVPYSNQVWRTTITQTRELAILFETMQVKFVKQIKYKGNRN